MVISLETMKVIDFLTLLMSFDGGDGTKLLRINQIRNFASTENDGS